MKNWKSILSVITAAALAASVTACGGAGAAKAGTAGTTETTENTETAEATDTTVKIGVVGENNEQWTPVIEKLAAEHIKIELVKFADYTLPNQALADGEIDLNSFQHHAYLENEIKDKGFDLTAIGETIIAPLGLYSEKIKDISELKDGDKIAIPSDATNGGRSLKVLESAGIIKVDPAAGYTPEVSDITENPKNIEFVQVEAAQTPSLLPDVAAAIINGGHAVDHGLNPQEDSLYLEQVQEGSDNPYINIIVARTEDKDNEIYQKIVDTFHSDEVAKVIEETYKGAYLPAWK